MDPNARCFYHPDRDALTYCTECDEPVCEECLRHVRGRPVCLTCAEEVLRILLGRRCRAAAVLNMVGFALLAVTLYLGGGPVGAAAGVVFVLVLLLTLVARGWRHGASKRLLSSMVAYAGAELLLLGWLWLMVHTALVKHGEMAAFVVPGAVSAWVVLVSFATIRGLSGAMLRPVPLWAAVLAVIPPIVSIAALIAAPLYFAIR